jgi:plasmid stabilization system protein ParE
VPAELKIPKNLVLPPLAFTAVYRVTEEAVEIARVLHGSKSWP